MKKQARDITLEELQLWANRLIDRHEKIRTSLLELNDTESVAYILDAASNDLSTISSLLSESSPDKARIAECARSLTARQRKTFPDYVLFGEYLEKWSAGD